jgi:putative peptidoglycan lipid II flippase
MTERGVITFVPGACAGRYRLLVRHGRRPRLEFWQAVDTSSGREVALTLVDPEGELPEEFVHEILARTVRLKGIASPGVALVLEVFYTGFFGVVVSEWIHGGSLRQIADTAPSPVGVASAMQSLAAAAEAAHRAGLVLSIDDPGRLRVSTDGHVALAFPATLPEATTQSDLRYIGGALYALMVNRWPFTESVPADWTAADVDSEGRPVEPATIDPRIPFLISAAVTGLVREEGGIASAGTLLTLLRQSAVEAADESNCRIMPLLPPPPPGCYAGFRNFGPDEQAQAARSHIIRVGLGAAAAIVVVAVLALASSVNGFLGDNDDVVAMDADKLGLNPTTSSRAPTTPQQPVQEAAAPGGRVQPAAAAVFSPDGSPDSPGDAGLAIDNNPGTAWSTDRYYDRDPFPKFKPGVGLLLQLPQPTPLSAVTVDLNSTGTVVHVRGVADKAPTTFADTTELSPPTPMQPGRNRIPVNSSAPVSGVLVWISTLGSADGKSQAAISEIELQAAAPPA